MLDCYGSTESKLDDVKYINNMLNHIAYEVGVITVAPPFLLPYYYGVDQNDMGVSAFLFLKGGHITIHTFPLRECYFIDMVYDANMKGKNHAYLNVYYRLRKPEAPCKSANAKSANSEMSRLIPTKTLVLTSSLVSKLPKNRRWKTFLNFWKTSLTKSI